jgi:hypothetical protein
MITDPTTACIVRSSPEGLTPNGLYRSDTIVESTSRKKKGTAANRPPFQWSELYAGVEFAPADRALTLWRRKDARMKGYTISLPGQTGMRSPSALLFPELAAGRGIER